MNQIFIQIFQRLYSEEMKSIKKSEGFLLTPDINSDSGEIEWNNYDYVYGDLLEFYSLLNSKGMSLSLVSSFKININSSNNAFINLLIIHSLFKMRKLLNEKNQNNEKDSYEIMIKFGLELDFVLTSIEKIKFLDEEYETFANFKKNSILKLFIPLFFYDVMDEKNDFILEFFFRYSIFEDGKNIFKK